MTGARYDPSTVTAALRALSAPLQSCWRAAIEYVQLPLGALVSEQLVVTTIPLQASPTVREAPVVASKARTW